MVAEVHFNLMVLMVVFGDGGGLVLLKCNVMGSWVYIGWC